MTTSHHVETMLADDWPPESWQDVTVLLAVSGGADSVALLRAISAIKTAGVGRLWAAHLNHRLRGEQSDADEAFVTDLCRQLNVPCEVGYANIQTTDADGINGLEEAARNARYNFLKKAAERVGARYVATAHTADDQAETILHRIVRGTGIAGLAGMSRIRRLSPAVTLIRPMLRLHRNELLEHLYHLGQPYRSDASNADVRFTRNRIRHELLPQLADHFNPGVVDALLRLGTLAGQLQRVVDSLVEDLFEKCVTVEDCNAVQIDTSALAGSSGYVVRELLIAVWRRQSWPMQAMGFAQWDLLGEMIFTLTESKQAFPGNVSAEVGHGRLLLQRRPLAASQ